MIDIKSEPVLMEEPLREEGQILLYPPPETVINIFTYDRVYAPTYFNLDIGDE